MKRARESASVEGVHVTVQTDPEVTKLAKRVDAGFEQVDERFKQVDAKFEKVDQRFDDLRLEIKGDIKELDTKLDVGLKGLDTKIDQKFDKLDSKFDKLDSKFNWLVGLIVLVSLSTASLAVAVAGLVHAGIIG